MYIQFVATFTNFLENWQKKSSKFCIAWKHSSFSKDEAKNEPDIFAYEKSHWSRNTRAVKRLKPNQTGMNFNLKFINANFNHI